jgi:two-component system, LuxR family, secretion system response regulator SsrB
MSIRVLLVDDVDDLRSLLREQLVGSDVTVVGEAANGEEALAACHLLQPDVIVLDVEMPVMGGIEALPHLRHRSPLSKVLVYSQDPIHDSAAVAAGADAFVCKQTVIDLTDSIHRLGTP